MVLWVSTRVERPEARLRRRRGIAVLKHHLSLALTLAIILVLSGCARSSGDVRATLGREVTLSAGQSASIASDDLRIRFVGVSEDSRCPKDVVCIQAGRVGCTIDLTRGGVSRSIALSQPGLTDEYSTETYEGYKLAFGVTPYPEAGKGIAADAYELHLTVSKSPR